MKITEIKVETIRLELKEPLKVAFGEIPYSENVLVKVMTDEGLAGYEEGRAVPVCARRNTCLGNGGAVPVQACPDRDGRAGHRRNSQNDGSDDCREYGSEMCGRSCLV